MSQSHGQGPDTQSGAQHTGGDGPEEELSGIAAYLTNHRIAILLVFFILGWGLTALRDMPKEKFPDVDIPLGMVLAIYPGAPPELVEARVTNVLEKKFKGLPRLRSLESSTIESASIIVVEFEASADVKESYALLSTALEEAKSDLPAEVERVDLKRVSVNNAPVMTFNLVGELPLDQKKELAKMLQNSLETLPGVSEIRIAGLQEEQLQVLLNRHRLEEIGASLNDVAFSLKSSQDEAPLGRIQSGTMNYGLQVDRIGLDIERLKLLPIRSSTTGESVPLQDVAEVKLAFAEAKEYTRLVQLKEGGVASESISFDVLRQPGANIVELAEAVQLKLEELEKRIPEGAELIVTMDTSREIKESVFLLLNNGWQAVLLVFLVLFLFLGVKESIVAGLSIPLTFLAVFGILQAMGYTINSLSLMALIIALGLLVDDFILVMEGMHENIHSGLSPKRSAVETLKTYALASVSGSMTTIAAFMPMALLDGVDGKFIQIIPITVTITLMVSYTVSMTIDLAVGAGWFKKAESNILTATVDKLLNRLSQWYYDVLTWRLMRSTSRRLLVLAAGVVALMVSIFFGTKTEQVLYPPTDYPQIGATLYLPAGTSLSETSKLAKRLEGLLREEHEMVKHFLITVGQKSSLAFTRPQSYLDPFRGEHILGVTIELRDKEERETPSYVYAETLREKLMVLSEGRLDIHQVRMGPSGGAPVEVLVTSDDPRRLYGIAEAVGLVMDDSPELGEVWDNRKEHVAAYRVKLDDQALKHHNLSRTQTLLFLRSAIEGKTADTVVEGDTEIDIQVAYDWRDDGVWNAPVSLEELLAMKVSGIFSSANVPLAAIGDLELKTSPSAISHVGRKLAVTVSADPVDGVSPIDAANALVDRFKDIRLDEGEAITFLGDKAKSEETQAELKSALLMAVGLIFTILVLQFGSFFQPIVVMASLPFALTGVFLGFYVFGIQFSFPSMIGVVSLAGIVVNDSIVLVDTCNRFRAEGMVVYEAMRQAGTQRLRPILSTTLTTVIGLLPLALTDPVWEGLCLAIVFGISLATLLILIMVPALYLLVEDRHGSHDAPPSQGGPSAGGGETTQALPKADPILV